MRKGNKLTGVSVVSRFGSPSGGGGLGGAIGGLGGKLGCGGGRADTL